MCFSTLAKNAELVKADRQPKVEHQQLGQANSKNHHGKGYEEAGKASKGQGRHLNGRKLANCN